MEASINLNDYVWVCLNEKGWKHLEKYYRDLFSPIQTDTSERTIKISINQHRKNTKQYFINGEHKDLTQFQLAEFMNIFGSKMYCGAECHIENNRIYLTVS